MLNPIKSRWFSALLLGTLLAGCGKFDSLSALEQAAQQLEEGIAGRKTAAVMELLHADFEGSQGMTRQQARQQMTGMFLRYQNIGLLVVNRHCEQDQGFYDRGHCSAQVGVSGAEGLIPQRAELYTVDTVWQLEGKDWLLREMHWE
ncbi:MAG: hypothetical protein RBR77_13505 [Thauera sp.]|jgi:hypothetical protein|nr:hypothetical protein [Thauera sp.]